MRLPFALRPTIPLPRFAYSYQTFSVAQVLTAAQVQQIEDNVRDHVHGVDDVSDSMGLALIEDITAAGAASIAFDAGFGTYDDYLLVMSDISPATDGADLYIQGSTDGGSNYLATNEYHTTRYGTIDAGGGGMFATGSTASGAIILATSLGNGTGEAFGGSVLISGLTGTTRYKTFRGQGNYYSSTPSNILMTSGGTLRTASAVTALRLIMSAGNISGRATLFGVRKA